jgi:hypothetical protein
MLPVSMAVGDRVCTSISDSWTVANMLTGLRRECTPPGEPRSTDSGVAVYEEHDLAPAPATRAITTEIETVIETIDSPRRAHSEIGRARRKLMSQKQTSA